MTEFDPNLGNIPTIWSAQLWADSTQNQKTFEKPDVAMFDNAPNDISLWSFFWKIFIWLMVWICVVALLFWTLAALGSITWSDWNQANPLLRFLLSLVWFIVHFVWSFALALMYNIFFSKRYYSLGKMFALIFVSSLILRLFFIIIYFLYDNIDSLYIILWFQVIFGLYVSLNLMDFLSQPNYSASSMMANNLWCILTVAVYIAVVHYIDLKLESTLKSRISLYALFPVLLSYTVMIFWAELWDAIYYKFYEWWNNPFYLPSLNELREERKKEEVEKAEEEEDVNVDMRQ